MLDTPSEAASAARTHRLPGLGAGTPAPPAHDLTLTPRAILAVLRRHRWKLFGSLLTVPLAVALALHGVTPRYTASGTLLYEPAEYRLAELQSILRADPITDSVLATQAEVVRGLPIVERVAAETHLFDNPEFNLALQRPSPLRRAIGWALRLVSAPRPVAPAAVVGPQLDPTRIAVLFQVQQALKVVPVHGSHVLTVSFMADDGRLAASVVNRVMDIYIKDQLAAKYRAVRKAKDWLDGRVADLRGEVRAEEDRIAAYRASHDLVQGMHGDLGAEQISHLTEGLVQARADLAGTEARLDAARGRAGAVSQAAISPSVVQFRAQQDALRAQLQGLSARLGANHPDVINLRQQLAATDRAVGAEITRVVGATEAEVRAARERVAALEADLKTAQTAVDQHQRSQIPLAAMQREADAARALLRDGLAHSQELAQQAAVEAPDAHEISLALPPSAPSSPRVVPLMGGAVAFGLLFGLLLVYVAEISDRSFRSGADVRAWLGLPCLALIPEVPRRRLGRMALSAYAAMQPLSPFAEQLRALRAGLWTGAPRPRLVAVTAARPSEGKTSVVLALGRAMALAGTRVCVLDCDVRQAAFARLLEADPTPGLTDLLAGRATEDQVLRTDTLTGMRFVTAGTSEASALGLFMSEAMGRLLQNLRDQFDLVLLDAPPAQAMTDTRVIAGVADATLLCLRWQTTPRAVAEHALALLSESGATVIGVALTRVDTRVHLHSGCADAEVYHPRYGGYYRG
jgi:succinoglycan biosynthesis transport protein ExoP